MDPQRWHVVVKTCAEELRSSIGVPDRGLEEKLERVFRAALRPRKRAGRRPDAETVTAANLFLAGMRVWRSRRPATTQPEPPLPALEKSPGARRLKEKPSETSRQTTLSEYQRRLWQRIYTQVFPDLGRMDRLTRQHKTATLRRKRTAAVSPDINLPNGG